MYPPQAALLLKRTALAEGIHAIHAKPVLHGDNGATFKATTVLAMLHWLKIKPSYSRPRVSDDNAFVESLFRTAKYRPEFPVKGFADLNAARQWASRFVHWYNHEHRHSGIRYVSPAQRHEGVDREILDEASCAVPAGARAQPRRWSRNTRNWSRIDVVTLNPEKESVARDIDTEELAFVSRVALSTRAESRLPLTWIALLHGRVRAALAVAQRASRTQAMWPATCSPAQMHVMSASALLRHGPSMPPCCSTASRRGWSARGSAPVSEVRGMLAVPPAEDARRPSSGPAT